ncbi:MAG TPA: hypothetical protein VFE63_16930 [Roseiarcus sp.]|jgi:hypothetical protein|nr:hypothetical protein [Roseiarcus sp.]
MLQIRVGLADMTRSVDNQTMAAAAAALNIQVTRDLPKFWNIDASVEYLTDAHSIPQGVWPVLIVKELPPDEGGFHMTRHNQPYAKIVATPGSDEWTVDASHETIEMLVDPSGNRLQTATAIKISGGKIVDSVGKFEYLVEACDPCEADASTYAINGIRVSDFITPDFYDPSPSTAVQYSFNGTVTKPRQILPGGYISFIDPVSNELQQIVWFGPTPVLRTLGPASGPSLRAFVDGKTRELSHKHMHGPSKKTAAERHAYRESLAKAARIRAKHYV